MELNTLEYGCAYPISGDRATIRYCGCRQRLGSSYCDVHHALCYLPKGSLEEMARVAATEKLARVAVTMTVAVLTPEVLDKLDSIAA